MKIFLLQILILNDQNDYEHASKKLNNFIKKIVDLLKAYA